MSEGHDGRVEWVRSGVGAFIHSTSQVVVVKTRSRGHGYEDYEANVQKPCISEGGEAHWVLSNQERNHFQAHCVYPLSSPLYFSPRRDRYCSYPSMHHRHRHRPQTIRLCGLSSEALLWGCSKPTSIAGMGRKSSEIAHWSLNVRV